MNERKSALREQAHRAVSELTRTQKEDAAVEICARLAEQTAWKNAHSVLLFVPLPDEPNIRPLLHAALDAGKLATLPRFNEKSGQYEAAVVRDLEKDLVPGKFGILEPTAACPAAALKRLDLVLVPGVAFDWQGHRLGRGKGFYDRLLEAVSGTKCGVAFDQQLVSTIPIEPHDVRLNCILTPSHWLEV